jgi:hypothetical protein
VSDDLNFHGGNTYSELGTEKQGVRHRDSAWAQLLSNFLLAMNGRMD